VTDRESNPRPLGCMSGDGTTHLKRSAVMSEKVSCDEWYWNPSPDISRYMCGARRVVRGLCCSQQVGFAGGEGGNKRMIDSHNKALK